MSEGEEGRLSHQKHIFNVGFKFSVVYFQQDLKFLLEIPAFISPDGALSRTGKLRLRLRLPSRGARG